MNSGSKNSDKLKSITEKKRKLHVHQIHGQSCLIWRKNNLFMRPLRTADLRNTIYFKTDKQCIKSICTVYEASPLPPTIQKCSQNILCTNTGILCQL